MNTTTHPPRTWLIAIVAVVIGLAWAPTGAMAQELPGITIALADGKPASVLHVEVEPGERASLEVQLEADAPLTAIAWVSDVVSPPNGGFGLSAADAERTGPAGWIEFEAETVDLAPDSTTERTLTVSVPAGTRPGLYVAALAVQATDALPVTGVTDVGQVARTVATIGITVPGEVVAGFELGEPTLVQQGSASMVQVPVTNTGTVPVYPMGTLTLESPTGQQVGSIPVTMGAVYAGGATVIELPLSGLPGGGDYGLSLTLTDANTRSMATLTGRTLAIPQVSTEPPSPEAVDSVTFQEIAIEPEGTPLASVGVSVEVANVGEPVAQATLTLVVSRNGQVVEEVAVADRVALADGITSFSTTYTPEAGFTPGLWTFRLRLDAIDEDGTATLIVQSGTLAKLDVP